MENEVRLSPLALAIGLDNPERRKRVIAWLTSQYAASQESVLPQASTQSAEKEERPLALCRERGVDRSQEPQNQNRQLPQTKRHQTLGKSGERQTLFQRLRALITLVCLLSFVLAPSRLGRFKCNLAAFFGSHGLEAAFTTDLPSALAHSSHDAGDGIGDFRSLRFLVTASRSADHLEGGAVYVPA